MHPGLVFWWSPPHRQDPEARAASSCSASSEGSWSSEGCGGGGGFDGGGGFGVRRPLRFLAHKLQLSDTQVGELARVLNELKTERAQAEVDDRRALAAFADAVASAGFDESRAGQAATTRVQSTQRLQDAVVKALGRIHVLLDETQRANLAYLIRTGTLAL